MATTNAKYIKVYANQIARDIALAMWACYEKGVLNSQSSTNYYSAISCANDRPYGLDYLTNTASTAHENVPERVYLSLFLGICADCNATYLASYLSHIKTDKKEKSGICVVADYFYRQGVEYGMKTRANVSPLNLPDFADAVSSARKCYYLGKTYAYPIFLNKVREAAALILCESENDTDREAVTDFMEFCANVIIRQKINDRKLRGYDED